MNNIVKVPLSQLNPDKRNARRHSEKNIAEIIRSIEAFEQHRPFVVQKGTNKILIGNGMYEAMKSMGIEEGLVLYVDDDDEKAVRRALSDNRTAELAEWDTDMLKELMQELGPGPNVPGWTVEELNELFDVPTSNLLPDSVLEQNENNTDPKMTTCPACGHLLL